VKEHNFVSARSSSRSRIWYAKVDAEASQKIIVQWF